MSGTSIAYGDRPIAYLQPGGAYATFEFLQFLERLTASHNSSAAGTAALQTQVNTNTSHISALTSEISTLTTEVNNAATTADQALGRVSLLTAHVPDQTAVAASAAVALTSGSVVQIASMTAPSGTNILMGMICLTGSGSVTLAQASVGLAAGSIETAPGAFGTAVFGGGASPGSLGVDLSIGTFVQQRYVAGPQPAYLNVKVNFTGSISAYGNIICWLVDG